VSLRSLRWFFGRLSSRARPVQLPIIGQRMPASAFQTQRCHHPLNMSQSPTSSSKNPATTTSSSNFKVVFDNALKAYKRKTKQDLITHPLASQLEECDSPADILTILQDQVHQFEQSRSGDERLRRWLDPTINVLHAFSETLGQGVGLVHIYRSLGVLALIPIRQVFSPANTIFAGAGVLLLVSALVCLLVRILVTSGVLRRPRTSKQAKISLSMFSNASKISFEDLKFTPMSHLLRR
jgi:fungal STAND N-terminal Goodbye domain